PTPMSPVSAPTPSAAGNMRATWAGAVVSSSSLRGRSIESAAMMTTTANIESWTAPEMNAARRAAAYEAGVAMPPMIAPIRNPTHGRGHPQIDAPRLPVAGRADEAQYADHDETHRDRLFCIEPQDVLEDRNG